MDQTLVESSDFWPSDSLPSPFFLLDRDRIHRKNRIVNWLPNDGNRSPFHDCSIYEHFSQVLAKMFRPCKSRTGSTEEDLPRHGPESLLGPKQGEKP